MTKNLRIPSLTQALFFTLIATGGVGLADETKPAPKTVPGITAVDESVLDKSTKPCDDFYQFACGGWLANTEIPADRPGWSRGFVAVAERNLQILRGMLENYSKGKLDPADKDTKKLGDLYGICMDEKKAETASMKTLKEEFKAIDALKDYQQLPALLASLHLKGVDAFFNYDSFQDFKDSSQMIAGADQGGLGLPDRDYYLTDAGKMPEIRKLYQDHMVKVFKLLKVPAATAAKNSKTIYDLEKQLAEASMSRVDRRDPEKVYHRLDRKGLVEKAPHFGWDAYFTALGYPKVNAINVLNPEFFAALDKMLTSTKIEDVKTYLRWKMTAKAMSTLGNKFVMERFNFTSKALGGEKELPARWKRCVGFVDGAMGEPLGRSYVQLTFGAKGKEESKDIMTGIENAFEQELKDLSWMDGATRKEALEKLHKITNQVGYPDKWRNYDGLVVSKESYLKDDLAATQFNIKYELDKIEKPVDRLAWHMTPPTVNAYYSPENNQMVFPAGILQLPYFNKDAPDSLNYGAIGGVMGHELTHGFDDTGKQFDAGGNLRNWWTDDVAKEFGKRTACMIKQYDGYVAIDDQHVNGKLTIGENIADQGGLKAAYKAFQTAKKRPGYQGAKGEKGFTDDQLFFLGYAQAWCSKYRPEQARMRVTVDPHSPPRYRVIGSLTNFPEFAKAYSCKSGDKMVPEKSCAVW